MKILDNIKKIYNLSKLTMLYTNKLKFIHKDNYSKLNDIKYQYTKDFLNFLNINLKINFEDNIGNNVDENNVLFVINHKSLLDIVVIENSLYHLKNKNINNFWIAKEELKDIFILGKFFTEVKSNIFIDRNNTESSKKMFKECKEILKNNKSNICIFPEGTRHKISNEMLPFKKGSDLLAKINKMKVIPIYIEENTQNLLKDKITEKSRTINVHIGKNIDYNDLENQYKLFVNKILKK